MADGIGQAYFFVNILDIRPYVGAQFFLRTHLDDLLQHEPFAIPAWVHLG